MISNKSETRRKGQMYEREEVGEWTKEEVGGMREGVGQMVGLVGQV